jgi:hypothetical protein
MQAFWTEYGFYLWALTTALVLVALIWLGWNTFAQAGGTEADDEENSGDLSALSAQVQELSEATPLMRASLGRSLQFVGLERYVDATGAPAFALALLNARGDGVLLTSTRGMLMTKSVTAWGLGGDSSSAEELATLQQARTQAEVRR